MTAPATKAEPTRDRRLEQGARSRERILDSASRLMANRGYAATSISAISHDCGLPASSIYWHFASKEELVAAVMERGAERWLASMPSFKHFSGTVAERVAAVFANFADRLEEHPEFLRVYMLLALERREIPAPSLATTRRVRERALTGLQTMLAALLTETGAKGRDDLAEELARFVLCFCDGSFVSHQVEPKNTDLNRLFDDLRIGVLAIAKARLAEMPRRKR